MAACLQHRQNRNVFTVKSGDDASDIWSQMRNGYGRCGTSERARVDGLIGAATPQRRLKPSALDKLRSVSQTDMPLKKHSADDHPEARDVKSFISSTRRITTALLNTTLEISTKSTVDMSQATYPIPYICNSNAMASHLSRTVRPENPLTISSDPPVGQHLLFSHAADYFPHDRKCFVYYSMAGSVVCITARQKVVCVLQDDRPPQMHIWNISVLDHINTVKHVKHFPNQKPWMNSEVCLLLKVRDAAFKSNDAEDYSRAKTNLKRGIRKDKHAHKLHIEEHFHNNSDPRCMWKGIQTITDHKPSIQSLPTSTAFLPDELNHFFARFDKGVIHHNRNADSSTVVHPMSLSTSEVHSALSRLVSALLMGSDHPYTLPKRQLIENIMYGHRTACWEA
ncbi:hypothetical protein QTP86_008197 [Hemibagrus guttatus]|nr:hypothetical protein QTP86_008197 [Hemibagrus guttatus]